MNMVASILHVVLALALAPLLPGVIGRVKAKFAGRRGAPLLQPYYDLAKLLRKGAVYSRTTTWVFRAGPVIGLAAAAGCLLLLPLGGISAVLAFPGDLLLWVYLLGLMRFVTVIAALDTGSSFEGMGASREVQFSMLAEPALLLGMAALVASSGCLSLSQLTGASRPGWLMGVTGPVTVLVAASWLVVLLAENARIPVDDPTTHLELTMIHEVMVLDHGGVDFGLIQYAAALKLWLFSALLAGVLLPVRTDWPLASLAVGVGSVLAVAVLVGIIESTMARLKLLRVPQLLVAAAVLAGLAVVLVLR
jgi:formate hydrogenlyase subunit 4